MTIKIKTLTLLGLSAEIVETEVAIHPHSMAAFIIVGLPDTAIQESRERVRAAIKNSGFTFPRGKVVVNLAPADIKKQGPRFDLAIALGILHATEQLTFPQDIEEKIFVGELGLTGEIRPITGILPTTSQALNMGFKEIFVPDKNAKEASLIEAISVFPCKSLMEVYNHLSGNAIKEEHEKTFLKNFTPKEITENDLQHIRGNEHGKRALEIAAAGGHNILMIGPPGSGKTMLAKAFATILPQLEIEESLEITNIHSIVGLTNENNPVITNRPFRTIHHTASGVAIVGGGNPPQPGEISLSHRGVLFLDEFAEFPQKTLEVLRQPLEDGVITISRASGSCTFPAKMMLIAAMNPCPCGFSGDEEKECTCHPSQISRYQGRISGPLLDRIDLHIEVPRITFEKLSTIEKSEPSKTIRARVQKAKDIQNERFKQNKANSNAEMTSQLTKKYCPLNEESKNLVKSAVTQMNLSGRAYYRILKLSRTIADLENAENIEVPHIAEAIQYREKVLNGV